MFKKILLSIEKRSTKKQKTESSNDKLRQGSDHPAEGGTIRFENKMDDVEVVLTIKQHLNNKNRSSDKP